MKNILCYWSCLPVFVSLKTFKDKDRLQVKRNFTSGNVKLTLTCVSRPCWFLPFSVLERKLTVSPMVSPLSNVWNSTNPLCLAPDARFFINSLGSVLREPQAWLHTTKSAPPAMPAGSGATRGSHWAEWTASFSRMVCCGVKRSLLVAVAV